MSIQNFHRETVKWIFAALAMLIQMVSLSVMANDELLSLMRQPGYWAYPGNNYHNWRYANLGQINNKNAGKLELAWTFATGSLASQVGGILVLPASITGLKANTLFIHTANPDDVLAINLDSLELEWVYEAPAMEDRVCCETLNYGIAYADGKIFVRQGRKTLIALNVRTGKEVWRVNTGNPPADTGVVGVPHPVKDYILTAITGAGGTTDGIAAYRIRDGGLVWKADNAGTSLQTLINENTLSLGKRLGSGLIQDNSDSVTQPQDMDSSWTWLAWDRRENLIYYSTSQHRTAEDTGKQWTSTIFARDVDTGVARWVYQMMPENPWGYDGSNEIILANVDVKGKQIPALIHFDRNGFAYTLNRRAGELLLVEKYEAVTNWATHIDLGTGKPVLRRELARTSNRSLVCPAISGAKGNQPAAYSPRTDLFYVPGSHTCMDINGTGRIQAGVESGMSPVSQRDLEIEIIPAGQVTNDGLRHRGDIIAWDAGEGKVVWSVPEKWPVRSGVMTTAGDVVFYGTLDGYIKLVDAKTGELLWRFKAPSAVLGSFSSWMHKGKQYVGVLTGTGSKPGRYKEARPRIRSGGTLMVFSLP